MNPNQFPWLPTSFSSNSLQNYPSLEQQFTNLNLSQEPSISNYFNYNNLALINGVNPNYNNSTTFAPSARGSNTVPISGPTARNFHANAAPLRRGDNSRVNILNSMTNEEYLDFLRYIHSNSSNNVSGFRARSQNVSHARTMMRNNYNRNNTSENYSINLEELRGNVANFLKDYQSCKLMQQMLENSNNNNEIINIIISEIKDNLGEIVVNNTSGQFFQNLLDYCCEAQVTLILRASMITQQSFVDICLDNHGSRAMQKLIRKINVTNDEQKSMILSMMKKVMLILITNMNSYYFVTELFSSLKGPAAYELITALFHEIGDHLLEIAMDKFGCCALHICLEHGHRSPQRDRVLNLIVSHALVLSQNDYGNYVIQYVISKQHEQLLDEVMRLLRGKFAYLCMNKYACHVVEKCIMFGTKQHLESIIVELIEDPNFLQILLHQTGNYVVQTAITRCNEVSGESRRLSSLFNKLTDGVIKYEYPFLRYDRLGKHVLLCAKTEKEKYRRRIMSYWPLSL